MLCVIESPTHLHFPLCKRVVDFVYLPLQGSWNGAGSVALAMIIEPETAYSLLVGRLQE